MRSADHDSIAHDEVGHVMGTSILKVLTYLCSTVLAETTTRSRLHSFSAYSKEVKVPFTSLKSHARDVPNACQPSKPVRDQRYEAQIEHFKIPVNR
jgi:hypothetical protein